MAGLLMDGGEFRAQRKEDVRPATSILSDDTTRGEMTRRRFIRDELSHEAMRNGCPLESTRWNAREQANLSGVPRRT
jgi:hypothetical protein